MGTIVRFDVGFVKADILQNFMTWVCLRCDWSQQQGEKQVRPGYHTKPGGAKTCGILPNGL